MLIEMVKGSYTPCLRVRKRGNTPGTAIKLLTEINVKMIFNNV